MGLFTVPTATALFILLAQLAIHGLPPALAVQSSSELTSKMLQDSQIDVQPKRAVEVFKSDVGTVQVWPASAQPMLLVAQVAASKLTLYSKGGLALPVYSDSPKLHYVIEGSAILGVVFPGTLQEYVRKVTAGDAVALPTGSVYWWYNPIGSQLSVISLGDTSKAHRIGQFTDIPLTGPSSVAQGYSLDFLSQAWQLEQSVVTRLVDSQKDTMLVRAQLDDIMPSNSSASFSPMYGEFVYRIVDAKKDPDVPNGGRATPLNSDYLPILKHIQLGSDLVELDPGGQVSPGYSADSAFQVTYIVRGSGRVEIVSPAGKRVVDAELTAGDFFICPRFHVVSKRAGNQGLQWFSIITTEKPIFTNLAGSTSIYKSLSPSLLRAAFNVDNYTESSFRQGRAQDPVFFPPFN